MDDYPFVTVVMAIYNEAQHINKALDAVLNQDYPSDRVEVIIADGMSSDSTRSIVKSISKIHYNIQLIDNDIKIVSSGLNKAIQIARGDIIIRVDGHTIIASDYILQCVNCLQRTGADNVGGKMNACGESIFGEAVAVATSCWFGIGSGRFHYSDKEEWVDTVYLGAWRRNIFQRVGLFDEELVRNQDDEFNYRIREQGGKILLSPDIKSKYEVRSTPRGLFLQYYQYGYWKVRIFQKHPKQMRFTHFVPLVFVLALIASIIISIISTKGIFAFVLLLGLYFLINNLISVYLTVKKQFKYYLLLPFVFSILHFSYGLGFLCGLFKFCNRWGDKNGRVPSSLFK
jgi:glycosyltransferase involved in cell wall biosynthesis